MIPATEAALRVAGAETGPVRVGRDGGLRLSVERRGERTVVARCRSTLPLQVLCPLPLDDPAAVVSVLNPTGGVVGGDRLTIEVDVGAGAHACLTTPSATKVYRSAGPVAVQTVALRVGAGATMEWAPDHTIPFAGSAYVQAIDADLAPAARLILVDAFAAGRVARGEAWSFRLLDAALHIRDAHGWLFADRFRLEGDPRWSRLGATDGHPYFATVLIATGRSAASPTPDAAIAAGRSAAVEPPTRREDHQLVRVLRDAAADIPDARIGVAPLPHSGVFARCLARSAPALLQTIETLWSTARGAYLRLKPLDLRKL